MKKQGILVIICLVGLWVVSCVKDNDLMTPKEKRVDNNSTAQLIKRLKTIGFEGTYALASHAGHKASDCGGNCTAVNGIKRHVDCQGFGNVCNLKASINISKNMPYDMTDIYYTAQGINDFEPIEDSSFNMPARSLYIKDDAFKKGYIYLNIPEQILHRDAASNQFIYNDITFTEDALFENL
jgi:hypothetical protein